nr:MAG TPA: hypothetical protein [Caudoviricetes sp.]
MYDAGFPVTVYSSNEKQEAFIMFENGFATRTESAKK